MQQHITTDEFSGYFSIGIHLVFIFIFLIKGLIFLFFYYEMHLNSFVVLFLFPCPVVGACCYQGCGVGVKESDTFCQSELGSIEISLTPLQGKVL